jgi:hypothetical protein
MEIKEYLPKSVVNRETLTASNIEDGVVVEVKEIKEVNTTFGKKLLAVVQLNDGEEYSLFLNRMSVQNIYQKEPDVNKWVGLKLKLTKIQVSIKGKLKQAILVSPM